MSKNAVVYTLVYPITKGGIILLGRHKKGRSKGFLNGYGGKVKADETLKDCAIRELREESTIKVDEDDLKPHGTVLFKHVQNFWGSTLVYLYSFQWDGVMPNETEVARPIPYYLHEIPISGIQEADRLFLPLILEKKHFTMCIEFDYSAGYRTDYIKTLTCSNPIPVSRILRISTTTEVVNGK